ncbi:MAG: RNA 2',3'-cyclic phosphodiesterase [Acidimicrobiia bacterium]|nr:RNA 2',3'-cyclic phosphodiesterase [Acidimicrobiia bacterium]
MSALARAFVAIRPPPPVLDAVARTVDHLRTEHPGLRWARRESWHLTLRFLGRVDDPDGVSDALGTLGDRPAPTLRLAGMGAFPTEQRSRALWVGCPDGFDAFAGLARAVDDAVAPWGFGEADHPAAAHLTVARSRRAFDAREMIGSVGDAPFGPSWTADRIVLYRSTTHPDGAVHDEVVSVALRG